MTDLNLDGLPALEALVVRTELVNDEFARRAVDELRRLVERERLVEAWECDVKNAAEQRLPAWAKPVMRAVRAVVNWYKYPGCPEAFAELEDEWDALTEAQLKEIGEDDG